MGKSLKRAEMTGNPNHKWIYTYDYAPDSVWEPWRMEEKPDWIRDEADLVAGRVRKDLPAWILLADSHFTYNGTWDDTVEAMRILSKKIPLRGIIHLGDLTDGLLTEKETTVITDRMIQDMKGISSNLYLLAGNHDYNYFRGNPEVIYPEIPQFYRDIDDIRLRMVFIDSFDPKESVRYGFTDYSIHWLDSVLKRMPAGYRAVIFSHVPPLVRLQAWTDNIRNREKLINVLNTHADKIMAFLNGHNHCDLIFNDLNNGKFPIISINCSKCEYFTEHKPEGAVVPERRLGDRTQESFDILQIDTLKNEIFFTRFGAGRDRVVSDSKAAWAEHT